MSVNQKKNVSYGLSQPLVGATPEPIISKRAPKVSDHAEIGTVWIDQPNNDGYILTSVIANVATWIGIGGGSGTFNAVTVNPGDLTMTAGDINVTAGTLNTPDITLTGYTEGIVTTDGTGAMGSSLGTSGQFLLTDIAGTDIAWSDLTSTGGSVTITQTAAGLNLESNAAGT